MAGTTGSPHDASKGFPLVEAGAGGLLEFLPMPSPLQPAEAILSAFELRLSFGNHLVLEDATLAICAGEKVGLVGRNGCGKSSFLRIVAGEEEPDAGTVSRKQGLVTGYLPQDFELAEDETVEANIRAGAAGLISLIHRYEHARNLSPGEMDRLHQAIDHADGWNLESRLDTLHRKLSAPPKQFPVRDLSGGEKRRVGLCRALLSQPDLLVLDEPTNHLDAEAIGWLESYLAESPCACLFVTHDRYLLDRLATRIVELAEGRFYSHEGNYSDYLLAKAERQERELAAEDKRQRFLRREIDWVRAGVKARTTKPRSRLESYYAVKAQKAPEQELDVDLVIPPPPPLGNVVVNLESVSFYAGPRPLFLGLNLEFRAGECLGIVGPNGVGKTTLLSVLRGALEPAAGKVTIGKRTVFNYVDQTRLELNEERSVLEEVAQGQDFVAFGAETLSVRGYLRRFLFSEERIQERIANLSGGEKNRVLLAKVLRHGGNFLVLDEPTNDLDLPTMRVLEEAIVNFGGTAVVVSHDRWFLDRVSDRLLVFEGEGKVTVHVGNYSYYIEKQKVREAQRLAAPDRPKAEKPSRRDAGEERPRKLTWKEARELEGMEAAILAAESAVAELEGRLHDPEFYREHAARAAGLHEELKARQAEVQALYERWEELEAIRSAGEAG